jgi:polyvinyl alcohol dehydrogenase (cytochrome)
MTSQPGRRRRLPPGRPPLRRPARLARTAGLAGLALAAWLAGGGLAGGTATAESGSSRPGAAGSWTVYHHDPAGSGVAGPMGSIRTDARAWTSPVLDGDIYGEPLVFAGRVYVATESNTVYALSAATGKADWSAHLGPPVPAEALPCGNITPTVGITGTPVIDAARREIFVVADVLTRGRPAHLLVGLRTASGKRTMTRAVDPPGANTAALLQRTGLTIAAGRVVFGFGGNFGDCSSYRGRVVAVSEAGGPPAYFTVDAAPDESRGAIWMGGAAPVVDAGGNLWVTAGNGSVTSSAQGYDNSDSVLKLSPSLRLLGFFAPSSWAEDNASDLDMSTGVALLPGGQVVAAGKSRIAYLLSAARPGGIGGQQAMLASVCDGDVAGGTAVLGRTVYLPCLSGIAAVRARSDPPSLHLLWSSDAGGGPPIVAGGLVWTIGQDGTLHGLDPASGNVLRQASVGEQANHFPTPSAAGGLLLAPTARQVVAFAAAPADQPTASASATASGAAPGDAADGQPAAGGQGGLSAAAVAGIVAGGLAVLAALGWLLWRRRIRGG